MFMKRLISLAMLTMVPLLLLSGCGDDSKVTGISLSSVKGTLMTTDTYNLKALVKPTTLSGVSLTWESSDSDVLTVEGETKTDGYTASAVVTPVAPGTGTITVTSQNGNKATCTITVEEPVVVESITLSSEKLNLIVDKSATLTADVYPMNSSDPKITWSSSDESVAHVNAESGLVRGKGDGTAIITATAPNGVKAQCKVEVHEMTPEYLDALIAEQPFRVISTSYSVQSDRWKTLYPDMLQATLKNDTELNIQNAIIAFVGWDKNGLPVKILDSGLNLDGGSYVRTVSYDNINMIPGATFGDNYGFRIDEECGIADFKAIAVSYEAFDGTTWQNPHYSAWRELYEGKIKP